MRVRTFLSSIFWPRNSAAWPEEDPANPRRINGGVNGTTALKFSGCWAATNAIAGLFGTMPAKVYRKTPEGREEASKHNVHRLLGREPNPEMDSFIFWEMLSQWWVNYGNAFAEIQRHEQSGKIAALWPIHPSRMTREKVNGDYTGRWLVRNNNGEDTPLEADEVFNIVGALSDDGVIGKGVVQYASDTIATALAEQGYRADFYSNGGRPSGTLEHPAKLSSEARENLRREWRTVHGRGNEIAILWEGMKFNATSVSPEHAEIINSSVFSIQEMARFYDLPPHVLYELSHGTFANVEEMNRFLVSHSLNRRLVRVEKACNRQLFTEQEKQQEYYVKFNVDALLRGNPKEQAEIDQVLFNIGAKNADEIRAHREMNSLPDGKGKTYYIRRDIAPIDLVIEAAKRDIENPAPIPGTPEKPDTPPKITDKWKEVARSYKTRWKNEIENYKAMEDELSGKIITLESALIERESSIETHIATIAGLTQERDRVTSARDSALSELQALNIRHGQDHREACVVRDSLEAKLATATESLATAQELRQTEFMQHTAHETNLKGEISKAEARAEAFKSKAEDLAIEAGSLRAECDGLKQQRDVIDGERIRANQDVIELRAELEKAGKATKTAQESAELARNSLNSHRETISASIRTLLDASLDSLLLKERNTIKEQSRNYDRFKETVAAFQLTFLAELTAHVGQAASALEAVGHSRVDAAKLASDYVAESRKRLNIAFNGANRNEIRSIIRAEVEGWENRKQELVSWIGEQKP